MINLIRFWRIGLNVRKNRQKYDKKYYTRDVLERAAKDYKVIAGISIIESDDAYECEFDSLEYPAELVINEFDNYLIELLNGNEI